MNSVYFMYCVYLSAMCVFIHRTHSLAILQPLRREVRFTKIDFHYSNESVGTVLECSIKQFPEKQTIFLHTIVHEKITNLNLRVSVSKCKDYYVDCVNVVSFEIVDVCSKINLIVDVAKSESTKQQMINGCPLFGEYYYKNSTFESDKFGSTFGLPTEKWWEFYWKMHLKFYTPDKTSAAFLNTQFYFIQLRNRNPKH